MMNPEQLAELSEIIEKKERQTRLLFELHSMLKSSEIYKLDDESASKWLGTVQDIGDTLDVEFKVILEAQSQLVHVLTEGQEIHWLN